jgi:hypothetical protein
MIMADTPTLQLIAYSSLTLASVIVATTSALIGFRQNFGWRPTLLVTGIGVSGVAGSTSYNGKVTFELWNRRRYPISIKEAAVLYGNIEILEGPQGGIWSKWRNTMTYYGKKIRIEPLSYHEFEVSAFFKADSLDGIDDTWFVDVRYFDPTSNKDVKMRAPVHYRLNNGKA